MNFEIFFNSLALTMIEHEDFQAAIQAIGFSWNHLPPCMAREAADKFISIRKKNGYGRAKLECSADHRMLSISGAKPSYVAGDIDNLSEKINKELEAARIFDLGQRLIKNPYDSQGHLRAYREEIIKGIETVFLNPILKVFGEEMEIENRESLSKIIIPDFPLTSDAISGFNPGRTGVLVAKTGFGKTNFALNLALSAAKIMRIFYVNMEMTLKDMARRGHAVISGQTYSTIYSNKFSSQIALDRAPPEKNFVLTSGRGLSMQQIEFAIRREALLHGDLGLIIIDYDQRINLTLDKYTPEWQAMKLAFEKFEDLAKELNAFILIMAQVNRDEKISSSHRATFSSHSLISFSDDDDHGPSLCLEKNRHGPQGAIIRLDYRPESSRLSEIEVIAPQKKPKASERKSKSILNHIPKNPVVPYKEN